MDKNPFAEDDVPVEASLAALYEWLLTYGYFPVDSAKLFRTRLDDNLGWAKCVRAGVLEDIPHKDALRLTPKIHELLKEYSDGHRTDTTT